MAWSYNSNGSCLSCKCVPTPSTPGTCTTYAVQVLDTAGNPVPDIAVTLRRRTGSAVPGFGTADPISGTTDSDGRFSYTFPASPPAAPENIDGASATIPMGGPSVAHASATVVGTTCTYRYRLCHASNATTTLDGDSGAPVSGVSLAGGLCDLVGGISGGTLSGNNCVTPQGGYPPWWEVSGPTHVRHAFSLAAIGPSGGAGDVGYWGNVGQGFVAGGGFMIGGGTSCKPGYWGDCAPTVATPCGTQSTSTIYVWNKDKFLLNPASQCFGSRRTVLERKVCVSFFAPTVVTGAAQYLVPWDPTSWDGNPCAPNAKGIRYRGVFAPGAATGSCQCSVYDEAGDVPYDAVLVEARIFRANNRWNLYAFATPYWNAPVSCGCPGDPGKNAGPHLECRRTLTDGTGRQVYDFRMPFEVGYSGDAWTGTGGANVVDIYGGHNQTAKVMNGATQFRWGCAGEFAATVTVADGACGGTYDTYGGGGDPGDDDMEILDPGPESNLATEDGIDLADEDGNQLRVE